MDDKSIYHLPVMLSEVIEALQIKSDGIYVDATFGGGGHSAAILKRLGKEGRLVAFDQDKDARQNLPDDPRIIFVAANFRHLSRFLRLHKVDKVDGILADLGVSSFQIDTASRGFSTRFDGPLNMRMDHSRQHTAADVLNTFSKDELQKLFQEYGEVTNARTLAGVIEEERKLKRFELISDLIAALRPIAKGNPQRYFAQVFQALRIQVNDELGALEELLKQSADVLNVGGRVAIITFHSLEDRIVKNFFKYGNAEGERRTDDFGNVLEVKLSAVTRKPTLPSPGEIKKNPRSRSAKLRVAERI